MAWRAEVGRQMPDVLGDPFLDLEGRLVLGAGGNEPMPLSRRVGQGSELLVDHFGLERGPFARHALGNHVRIVTFLVAAD